MHASEIIFSKFQGKYEKIKIIYIYNFKIFVKKKFIKDNIKKKFKLTMENCKKFFPL